MSIETEFGRTKALDGQHGNTKIVVLAPFREAWLDTLDIGYMGPPKPAVANNDKEK